jgi:hypothetical protein
MQVTRLGQVGIGVRAYPGFLAKAPAEVEPPQPQPDIVIGGAVGPPRPRPRVRPPIVAVVASGQGRQSTQAKVGLDLIAVAHAEQAALSAEAISTLGMVASLASAQTQRADVFSGLVMRSAISGSQGEQGSNMPAEFLIDVTIKSGGHAPRSPSYSGKPLPRVFMNQ